MTGSLKAVLTWRLIVIGALLTAVNVASVSAYYYLVDRAALAREKTETEIDRLAGAMEISGGVARLGQDTDLSIYSNYPAAYAFRVFSADGTLIMGRNALGVPEAKWNPLAAPQVWWTRIETIEGPVEMGARRIEREGAVYVIAFAASPADPAHLLRGVFLDELIGHVALPLLPFAFLLTVINIVTVGRSLASLDRAAAGARRLARGETIAPLPAAGLPAEVQSLVETINQGLVRVSSSLEAERAFAAEAAHALRTPLAVLAARIEAAGSDSVPHGFAGDVASLQRLTAQLLGAAQADTLVVAPDAVCDLAEVAETVTAAMGPLAIRSGRLLALEGAGPLSVRGDADALAHALRNLIENAIRFAPEGSEIAIEVGPGPVLSVRDTGPGIAVEDRAVALSRFQRAPGGRGGGTGLGLSIATRIVAAHGGSLKLDETRGGGLTARIVLPENAVRAKQRQGGRPSPGTSQP